MYNILSTLLKAMKYTIEPITMFTNEGVIDNLYMYNVDAGSDELFNNKGTVNCIKDDLI